MSSSVETPPDSPQAINPAASDMATIHLTALGEPAQCRTENMTISLEVIDSLNASREAERVRKHNGDGRLQLPPCSLNICPISKPD